MRVRRASYLFEMSVQRSSSPRGHSSIFHPFNERREILVGVNNTARKRNHLRVDVEKGRHQNRRKDTPLLADNLPGCASLAEVYTSVFNGKSRPRMSLACPARSQVCLGIDRQRNFSRKFTHLWAKKILSFPEKPSRIRNRRSPNR